MPSLDEVGELLAQCLQAAEPEKQRQALAELCRRRPEIADELQQRYRALNWLGFSDSQEGLGPDFPERLGDFKLLERLGGGGMGIVYRARQESLDREVALKLIRPEQLFFPSARERFQREIEAISRLQHPGIVPVYSIGQEQGIPYFVMERIRGCTLAEVLETLGGRTPESLRGCDLADAIEAYCGVRVEDRAAPMFRGRWTRTVIEIGRQISEALDHAHGRGILHRDVKPSNIAITVEGRAMLLDFGLTSASSGSERVTRTGSPVGTLFYMAPEQLQDPTTSDERSDVYSLGVTLYELLTLRLPYRGRQRQETEHKILDGRADSPRARNREVSSDLEQVVAMAMQVDPQCRYLRAFDFAQDLRNLLERRPIQARSPGTAYRLRRWFARRPALASALGLGLLLGIGTPTALWVQQRGHSEQLQERVQRFESVQELLVEIFGVSDPSRSFGESVSARELLDRGAERLRTDLRDQPRTLVSMQRVIGRVYANLGLHDRAYAQYAAAVEVIEANPGFREAELAELLSAAGLMKKELGAWRESQQLLERAQRLNGRVFGVEHWRSVLTRVRLGQLRVAQQDFEAGESMLRSGLQALERNPNVPPVALGQAHHKLALAILSRAQLGDYPDVRAALEQAESHQRAAIELLARGGTPTELQVAELELGLGLICKRLGRFEEAEQAYRDAIRVFHRLQGSESVLLANGLLNLSGLLQSRGLLQEALPPLQDAHKIYHRLLKPDHPNAVLARGNLAGLLHVSGRYADSEAHYPEVITLQQQTNPGFPIILAYSYNNLGRCRLVRGAFAEARDPLERALALFERVRGPEHRDLLLPLGNLIDAYLGLGQIEEAEANLRRCRALLAQVSEPGLHHAYYWMRMGELCRLHADCVLTELHLRRSLNLLDELDPTLAKRFPVVSAWGRFLADSGRHAEAEPFLEEAWEILQAAPEERLFAKQQNLLALSKVRAALGRKHSHERLLVSLQR